MWGYTPRANVDILKIHFDLSRELSDLQWKRVDLWNNDISVHEFEVNGNFYAFDINFRVNEYRVTLVLRNKNDLENIRRGLSLEGILFQENENNHGRFWIKSVRFGEAPASTKEIAETIRHVRRSVELTAHTVFSYEDKISGLSVNYSIKEECKSNDNLIFLFTSIRSKNHWIDFDGPFGASLKIIRARVVFVMDDAASAYTYNFAINSDLAIFLANVRFIKNYVDTNNYDWSKVTLAGLSKGATSAILIGSRLPSCTVVALAPQLMLGNYLLRSKRNEIIMEMSGAPGKIGAEKIDDLMWQALELATTAWGIESFYMLTSEGDQDCIEGLNRLTELVKQNASNHLEVYVDRTDFTSTHLKTVHHLMPQFLVILGAITSAMKNFKFQGPK